MSKELASLTAVLAMLSNLSFAMRSILRKKLDSDYKKRTGLSDPAIEHCLTTAFSFIILSCVTLYMEPYDSIMAHFNTKIASKNAFLFNCFVCGLSFYFYNELQNIVLDLIGAVPMAVGNTLKRVAIFIALFFFVEGETFPPAKVVGCTIAIVGCLCYAVFDQQKI